MKKFLSSFLLSFSLAVAAIASPVKSNLGGDGMENCDAPESTAQLYIQDGLVAMWDGIENVGWGVHDDNAIAWIDLVNNQECILTGNASWREDALRGNGDGPMASFPTGIRPQTVECVFRSLRPQLTLNGDCIYNLGLGGKNYYTGWMIISTRAGTCIEYSGWATAYGAAELSRRDDTYLYNKKMSSGAIFNGIDDFTTYKIFVNGFPHTRVGSDNGMSSSPAILGGQISSSTVNLRAFMGDIFALRFYNRVLSDEEIAYNYSIDKERFGL